MENDTPILQDQGDHNYNHDRTEKWVTNLYVGYCNIRFSQFVRTTH